MLTSDRDQKDAPYNSHPLTRKSGVIESWRPLVSLRPVWAERSTTRKTVRSGDRDGKLKSKSSTPSDGHLPSSVSIRSDRDNRSETMQSHNGDDDDTAPLLIQRASVTGAAAPVPLEVIDVVAHLSFVLCTFAASPARKLVVAHCARGCSLAIPPASSS